MQAQQGQNDAAAQQIAALRQEVAALRQEVAALRQEVAALRQEVAALRDTSTQFDMSLEHNVQRLEERMGRVEIKAAAQAARSVSPSEQTAGLH